ncbi:hypothetical protein [Spirosoma foliorum]|uniref:hypothetical protein n=1 Tax=Spirosoma foliorum TaxID=2710596 RepID=UPI001F0ACBD8|nr:hypothetical protein [Spirosoma foliorum]
MSRIDGVLNESVPWVYVSERAGSSVNLTVYFWVESHQANALKVSDQVPYPHSVILLASKPIN